MTGGWRGSGLMRLVDLGAAPVEVLRGAVSNRVIGAVAERALRLRGLPADEADVPASARAVLLAGELQEVSRAAFLAHRMTSADPGSDPWLPPELKEAFDHAADRWPGGATALVAAIARAAPGTFALLARPLSQHPDPEWRRGPASTPGSAGDGDRFASEGEGQVTICPGAQERSGRIAQGGRRLRVRRPVGVRAHPSPPRL